MQRTLSTTVETYICCKPHNFCFSSPSIWEQWLVWRHIFCDSRGPCPHSVSTVCFAGHLLPARPSWCAVNTWAVIPWILQSMWDGNWGLVLDFWNWSCLLIVLISLHVKKKYGVGGLGGKDGESQRGETVFSSSSVWFLMSQGTPVEFPPSCGRKRLFRMDCHSSLAQVRLHWGFSEQVHCTYSHPWRNMQDQRKTESFSLEHELEGKLRLYHFILEQN